MKKFIAFAFSLLAVTILFGQKTDFPKGRERAVFEQRTNGTEIVFSTFVLNEGTLSDTLENFYLERMESEFDYLSIEFLSNSEVRIEHQATVTDARMFKLLNRRGRIFVRKTIAVLPEDK